MAASCLIRLSFKITQKYHLTVHVLVWECSSQALMTAGFPSNRCSYGLNSEWIFSGCLSPLFRGLFSFFPQNAVRKKIPHRPSNRLAPGEFLLCLELSVCLSVFLLQSPSILFIIRHGDRLMLSRISVTPAKMLSRAEGCTSTQPKFEGKQM